MPEEPSQYPGKDKSGVLGGQHGVPGCDCGHEFLLGRIRRPRENDQRAGEVFDGIQTGTDEMLDPGG
jgi:hypothetical protein